MRISYTGFLLHNYITHNKIENKDKKTLLHTSTIENKQAPHFHQNISFKSNFEGISKEILNNIKENKLYGLTPETQIDKNTAKKIILGVISRELPDYNAKNGDIEKILEKGYYTELEAKMLAKLYILEILRCNNFADPKQEINFSSIQNDLKFFYQNDFPNKEKFFDKYYRRLSILYNNSDNYQIVDYKNVAKLAKDKNGFHEEILDMWTERSWLNSEFIKIFRKNDIINCDFLKLRQILPYQNFLIDDKNGKIAKCITDNKFNIDNNALKCIENNKNFIVFTEDYSKLFDFIIFAKDKNGEYNPEYNKILNSIRKNSPRFNNCFRYIIPRIIKDCVTKEGNKKSIDKQKIQILLDSQKNLKNTNLKNFGESSLNQYFININANKENLETYKMLFKKNISQDLNAYNRVFSYCCRDAGDISSQNSKIVENIINEISADTDTICKICSVLEKSNYELELYTYKKILENYKRTNIDINVLTLLAGPLFNQKAPDVKILNNLDKMVDIYLDFEKKYLPKFIERYENDKNTLDKNAIINVFHKKASNVIRQIAYKNYYVEKNNFKNFEKLAEKIGFNSAAIIETNFDHSQKQSKEFVKIIKHAQENKQLLRNGIEELNDETLKEKFSKNFNYITEQYDFLGEKLFYHTFNLKMEEFLNLCKKCYAIYDIPKEKIQKYIAPEKTATYKKAQQKIIQLKKSLSEQLTAEEKIAHNKNKKQIEKLKKEISILKAELKNSENDAIKKQISNKNKQIKVLTKEIQSFLNKEETKTIIEEIKTNQTIIATMDSEKITDPDEAIKHLNNLLIIENCLKKEDVEYYLNSMSKKDEKTKQELSDFLQTKLFSRNNIEYTENLKKYLNFSKSKYIPELFSNTDKDNSYYSFWENFRNLCKILEKQNGETVKEKLDSLKQNILTKQIFEKQGINYEKWTTVDKNSFIKVAVETDVEKEKQSVIKNLEEDLTSDLWNHIPEEETEKVFSKLRKIGVKLTNVNESIFNEDGFNIGTKTVKRLYKNNKQIEFKDIESILNTLKTVMNKEDFWNKRQNHNEEIETNNAKNTISYHILKMRENEFHNAKNLKTNTTSNIEVHKTDMNDINHAMFLGNHSACCTAIGGCNGWSAIKYIENKCISAIEIMDDKEFVGNTMCFFAEVDGELALILDNIELIGKYQFNNKIKDAIIKYAERLCTEVGKPNLRIYAGQNRHKIKMDNFELKLNNKIRPIGITDNEVYLDLITNDYEFNSEIDKEGFTTNLYRIR